MRSSITVLSPARSHDLTTLAALKTELNVKPGDRSKDDQLLRYIRQATGVINTACGRPFGLERVSEQFLIDDDLSDTLVLLRKPVVGAIESVTQGDDDLLDAASYQLDAERGLLRRSPPNSGWGWGRPRCQGGWTGQVTVVYSGGFILVDSLPDNVERACLILATSYFRSAGRDTSIRSINVPDVDAVTYAASDGALLPPDVKDLIRAFLRVI
jgi:hypothetical protein